MSRQILTSGASEEVPDRSDFARRLKNSLRSEKRTCIDVYDLYNVVRHVETSWSTQPLLGSIPNSQHDARGSFMFYKKPDNIDSQSVDQAARPQIPRGTQINNTGFTTDPARFWSVGVSMGSSFSAPWLIGTVHGTIAPFRNSFLEIGLDAGLASGSPKFDYYSLYPFLNYAFFMAFRNGGGWYIGTGGGYMYAQYQYLDRKFLVNIAAMNFLVGVNLWNMLDISYTLRTDFNEVSNKISIGYVKRF